MLLAPSSLLHFTSKRYYQSQSEHSIREETSFGVHRPPKDEWVQEIKVVEQSWVRHFTAGRPCTSRHIYRHCQATRGKHLLKNFDRFCGYYRVLLLHIVIPYQLHPTSMLMAGSCGICGSRHRYRSDVRVIGLHRYTPVNQGAAKLLQLFPEPTRCCR